MAEPCFAWTGRSHRNWLASIKLAHAEQRFVFEELKVAEKQAQDRIDRIEKVIREAVPAWSLREVVAALLAVRGIQLIAAVTLIAEIGDLTRFSNASELMGYLGLVPREDSTGDKVKRGSITKAGNGRARTTLVEASWTYRHPPRVGRAKLAMVEAAPEAVQAIAWKAQVRLSSRYRALVKRGKPSCVAVTAVARELAGFIWAIGQEVRPPSPTGAR